MSFCYYNAANGGGDSHAMYEHIEKSRVGLLLSWCRALRLEGSMGGKSIHPLHIKISRTLYDGKSPTGVQVMYERSVTYVDVESR